jgi:hypothetical protein
MYISPTVDNQHDFKNVYFVPVEKQRFEDIRIEFLTLEGTWFPFKYIKTPVKVVLHFRRIPTV